MRDHLGGDRGELCRRRGHGPGRHSAGSRAARRPSPVILSMLSSSGVTRRSGSAFGPLARSSMYASAARRVPRSVCGVRHRRARGSAGRGRRGASRPRTAGTCRTSSGALVNPAIRVVIRCDPPAGCELERGLGRAELRRPRIEVLHPGGFEVVGAQEALHDEHLAHRVRHRGAGGERDAAGRRGASRSQPSFITRSSALAEPGHGQLLDRRGHVQVLVGCASSTNR